MPLCHLYRWIEKINEEQKRCISEKNQVRMALSTSALEYVLENLEKATITFGEYTYLSEHRKTVLLLCEVSDKLKDGVIAHALKTRGEEIETFHKFHKLLRNLWSSCNTAVKGESCQRFKLDLFLALIIDEKLRTDLC